MAKRNHLTPLPFKGLKNAKIKFMQCDSECPQSPTLQTFCGKFIHSFSTVIKSTAVFYNTRTEILTDGQSIWPLQACVNDDRTLSAIQCRPLYLSVFTPVCPVQVPANHRPTGVFICQSRTGTCQSQTYRCVHLPITVQVPVNHRPTGVFICQSQYKYLSITNLQVCSSANHSTGTCQSQTYRCVHLPII